MTEMVFNLDSYKMPSERILRNRQVFYELWRKRDDKITPWLKRVQNTIRCCEFPKIILEFLLFDRFIGGLDANELESIQNVSESWTLKQLLEYYSEENVVSGDKNIESYLTMEDENTSIGVVKSEPNEGEWIQIRPSNQSSDEVDPFAEIKPNIIEDEHASVDDNIVSETEETNSRLSLNEKKIDNDMQFESEDHKFFIVLDAATVIVDTIGEENGKNHLNKKKGGEHERPFGCDQCDKAFNSAGSLKRHKLVHQLIRPHACEQCDKRFFSPFDLTRHSRTHTGERSHACDECDKLFTTSSNLSAHKKIVHRGIRSQASHVCNECGKRCITPAELKRHLVVHTGEKPFACDQCNDAFTLPGTLKIHKDRIHQRIRSHACKQCDKCFTTSAELKRHSMIHSEERPLYACNECDKFFSYSSSLTNHKKIVHREIRSYACEQCGKCFTERTTLRQHYVIHTGVKPFSCDQCGKAFNLLSNLKTHQINVHQRIHPYACDQCNKAFSRPGYLEKHKKMMH